MFGFDLVCIMLGLFAGMHFSPGTLILVLLGGLACILGSIGVMAFGAWGDEGEQQVQVRRQAMHVRLQPPQSPAAPLWFAAPALPGGPYAMPLSRRAIASRLQSQVVF